MFPPFDLDRLMKIIFDPKAEEKICIFIDLDDPSDAIDFAFLNQPDLSIQRKAFEVFYQGLPGSDFYAYKTTGGSNLDLPTTVTAPSGDILDLNRDIYPKYDIVLCISTFSATAPLTAAAKRFKFRGATMHGLNDLILQTGLAVDYNNVSRQAELLRSGMTGADAIEIDFSVGDIKTTLFIALNRQEAQKSHGICRQAPDIVNLPAGEVYFVPVNAQGSFPIRFEEGSLGLLQVENGRAVKATYIRGDKKVVDHFQAKLDADPATGILGEVGFGTQELPFSGSDIQDEKIFGTFHLATGRNDHLDGAVTKEQFNNPRNATHEDILFSLEKTPEIQVRQVRMQRNGKMEVLIENYKPAAYLLKLLENACVL